MSCAALAAGQNAAPRASPLGTPVAPPSVERDAIRLSGTTRNPAPEAWEVMEGGLPAGASPETTANFGGPELWVRNVSKPTLAPFLPDPSTATGAAMIIAPGSGYTRMAIDREGYSVAKWLTQRGIAAFVLKYRLAPMPADPQAFSDTLHRWLTRTPPVASKNASDALRRIPELERAMPAVREDELEAVRYVRAHASQWRLAPDRIGLIGFSAGAVTAIEVAQQADAASRPDLIAVIYGFPPNPTPVPATAPQAFIASAGDDPVTSSGIATVYNAWRSAGVPAELHVFDAGGHGFGLIQQGKSSDQWPQLFDHWLSARGFEASK